MFKVTKDAMRPASDQPQCFYCQRAIGNDHQSDCVLISKTVKVRAIIEYDVRVPSDWDKAQVEFHRNDGSWCADNMIGELEEAVEANHCLCGIVRFEMIKDSDEYFLHEA